jgi:hypothetical protein
MDEKDVYRSAALMIKRYGDLAEAECTKRADLLLDQGEHEGSAWWKVIRNAMIELKGMRPKDGEKIH